MLKEVADLNKRVETMTKEREEILAMKVSQLGLKPDESSTENISEKKNDDDIEDESDEDNE